MGEGIARDCCTRRKTARRTCLSRNTGINPHKLAEIPGRVIRLRTQPEENSCGEADGGASARPEPRHKDELSDPGGGPAALPPPLPLGRLAVFLSPRGTALLPAHGAVPHPPSLSKLTLCALSDGPAPPAIPLCGRPGRLSRLSPAHRRPTSCLGAFGPLSAVSGPKRGRSGGSAASGRQNGPQTAVLGPTRPETLTRQQGFTPARTARR